MPKASNSQQAFLCEHGIELPAPQKYWRMRRWSWQEATMIISFLKDGNGIGKATTLEERRDLYLIARKKYEGKTIVHRDYIIMPKNESGLVRSLILYLMPKTTGQVGMECQKGAKLNEVLPFWAEMVDEGDPIDYEGHIHGGSLNGILLTANKKVKGKLFDAIFKHRINQLQKAVRKANYSYNWERQLRWIYQYCEQIEQNGSSKSLERYIQLIQLFLEKKDKPDPKEIAEFWLIRANAIEYLTGLHVLKIDLKWPIESTKEQTEKLKNTELGRKSFELTSPERIEQFLFLDTYVLEAIYSHRLNSQPINL